MGKRRVRRTRIRTKMRSKRASMTVLIHEVNAVKYQQILLWWCLFLSSSCCSFILPQHTPLHAKPKKG